MQWIESKQTNKSAAPSNGKVHSTPSQELEKNKRIVLDENSRVVLEKRYLRKGSDGKPAETIEGMFDRIAKCVAEPDLGYKDITRTQTEFYNLLSTKKFFPNSPTFTGAGTPLGQLAACFVLPIADDLGKGDDSIFSTLRVATLIQQVGGGNGFAFSRLRPKGAIVHTSNGHATGPVGFLEVYDSAFGEIAQGGARRGANMAVLNVSHPDIREFIKCKSEEGKIANFNISVGITDKFMQAVESDSMFDLVDPHDGSVMETVRAREIFDMIVHYAHKNGEPGVLFLDAANRTNPVPHKYVLEATNPCGEQWLGPYENCCLGSLNLAQHLSEDGSLDWEALRESVALSTRFLDNVVSANKYVPEVPRLREAAEDVRRIGLGFMGLADVMYSMGVRYGSDDGCELAAQISEFIRFHSMLTSIELAKERGSFKAIKGSIYDSESFSWAPPVPIKPFRRNFGRPSLDWQEVTTGIKQYGIRNGAQTTVAPTGTISTVAGCEGYGCEPVFALAYLRNVYQAAGDTNVSRLTLTYTSPLFEKALRRLGLEGDAYKQVVDEVVKTGSCQHIQELPADVRRVFVVSSDITPDEHVDMQASIQAFIDNSLSKTCNFPETAVEEDVAKVYLKAWKLGCKGITVYVTGSRQEVVLETHETKKKKERGAEEKTVNISETRQRPERLDGVTYKINTPQGKAYVNITKDKSGEPFEVFITVGKAGSDVSGLSEALGRLISGWLRSSADTTLTVKEVISQMIGIGGSSSVGFGPNKVSSVPDAVAKIFAKEFDIAVRQNGSDVIEPNKKEISVFSHTDMCPDCGNATLVLEEGCSKCYTCGFSKC